MITCALTREQVFDLANDVYAHINANAETFDIDQYMTDLFDMVALQTGSVNRAAMFVQTAFAIINKGRSISTFKTLLDETKYREDAILDMVNRFTDPVEGLERIFIYIGFRPAGTLPSTAATGPATTTTTTPISAEDEEEEEEKETSLVPGEKIVVSDITYEDFELLPNTSEFAQLRALKQRLDEKFADLKSKEPSLYRDINNFLKTTIARTIIEQYNTALSTGAVSPSRKKPDNIKLKTTGQEVTSDQSLLYVSSLYQSLKNKLSGLNKTDAGYADLQEDVSNLGAFLKELQSFRNKDVAIVEQEIERVLNAIAARMQAIETGRDGKPVATSKAYLINEEEYARVSVIVEGILQRYFRIKPFGIVADINTYLNKLNSDLRVDRNLNVREHLEKFIGPSTRNKITGAKALKILDEYIASKPDFLEVLADPTTPSNVLIEYFDDFGLLLSERLYDASRDVGNEFDAGVRDFVADVDTSVKETELLSKGAAEQLEEILKPFREAVGQIASETEILFDEDTKIAGQMDLLFIDENQEWWIVDVKTGKAAKWKKYGLGTDDYKTYIRNALQQIIYKRILQKITGLDKVNLGILPLQVDYDDTTGKINSVEQPSKVKNQALSPEQPFITINENEKFVVFASDSVDDDTKREMTLSQMVDEIFKERSAFVTEEETEDTEEETEEVGGATDTIADIEQQKQKQLENRVKELEDQRRALRSEDGSIPADKMSEFQRLGKEINKAKEAAIRGNSTNSMLIKMFSEGADKATTDPEILSSEAKKEAADIIEQVIQNSKTAEEAFKEIRELGYVFDINVTQALNKYLEDRFDPNAPKVGNNKDSFQAWIYGKTDAELKALEGEGATGTGVGTDNNISNGDKIISVQAKPVTNEIKNTDGELFLTNDNNPETRIYINMNPLKDILVVPNNTLTVIDKRTGKEVVNKELNPEGAVIFEAMQGRLFVVANINGQLVPFYKSSAGTSGKTQGDWYPFFGFTGAWLVKGGIDKATGKMSYSPEIDKVTTLLNENLVFPDKYIGRDTNTIKNTKGEVIIDMNQLFKINRLWQKQFGSQTGNGTDYQIKGLKENTTSESGLVALITGLNSTDLDSSKTPKELSEWFNLISKNAELSVSEEGAEETPTEIELTDDQVNTLNRIKNQRRGEYIIAKADFIRELINAGNTLSGKITHNKRYNSFTLDVTVNGEVIKLAVYIDNDKKEQYQDPGDKEFTISLLSESVIEDFGISMVYEDVLNVVDKETGETIGRVAVTDASVFENKKEATNILREKISNATTAEELYLLKNDIVKFLIDYGYDETTDSLTKALDERLDNLKIRRIGEFDFFHKKDETSSINTAYKIVSYNATKKEITVSLVTDPSVKETISTSEFMNTFNPIVDATETPAKLTTEETLLLDITDENLQKVMLDPSFFTQEVTEDSKDLEDDLANNAKC